MQEQIEKSKNKQTFVFLSLSKDLQLVVLLFLDLNSLASIARVSKFLNELSGDDLFWKQKLLAKNISLPSSSSISLKQYYKKNCKFWIEKNQIDPLETLKILLVGEMTKKTELVSLFVNSPEEKNILGVDCKFKQLIVDDKAVKLAVYDMAGMERLASSSQLFYSRASGIFLMCNPADKNCLTTLQTHYDNVIAILPKDKLMILGVNENIKLQEEINADKVKEFATKVGLEYLAVNLENTNTIVEAFATLTRQIQSKEEIEIKAENKPRGCTMA